jgi:hypothetical protein
MALELVIAAINIRGETNPLSLIGLYYKVKRSDQLKDEGLNEN